MTDAMTVAASLGRNKTMWDRAMFYGLRPMKVFDTFATVKQTDATPDTGGVLTFTLWTDMTVASTSINESVDIDAVALADTPVSVTLAEYGNAVNTTWKVRATSFVPLDRGMANVIGENAGLSQDTIARDVMKAGTNVRYATKGGTDPTARNMIEPEDVISAHDIRLVVTDLEAADARKFGALEAGEGSGDDGGRVNGTYYTGVIHPHVALDLREETGAGAWRTPREYADPSAIYNGEIGEFEGARWIKTTQAPKFADAGSSTTLTDVYRTMVFGQQALAKAYSTYDGHGPHPTIVFSPVVDKLRRFQPLGWHWFGGYGIFRQPSLRAIETSSSVGTNS